MNKRTSAPARVLALAAVIGGFVLVLVMLSAALSDDSGDTGKTGSGGGDVTREAPKKDTPAVYVVEDGDTLTAIAHSTGVPVAAIVRLNPGVDPQILNPGEKLKLR